jgi:hypothetical protein
MLSAARDTNGFDLIVKSSLHLGTKDDYSVVPLVSIVESERGGGLIYSLQGL